jgi:hypothetical protein
VQRCERGQFEKFNFALGHAVKWRLRIDALTKIEDRDRC